MSNSAKYFDPLAASAELHFLLVKELRQRDMALDLVYHGTSGVITVFKPAEWAGRGREICDIFPTQHQSWFIEWRDGKTFHGSGGNFALVEVLMRGLIENLNTAKTD